MTKAELVIKGGPIYQSLARGPCEALAIESGRVVATGPEREVDALRGPRTRVIDLRGRSAVPGFNDAHQHLLSLGRSMQQVSLRPGVVRTLAELLAAIEAEAAKTPRGEWVFGGRYDHFHLDVKRHPRREELDRAAPEHPVYIKRICAHMGVANSRALERAGITGDTPDPPGGRIEKRDGRPTGLLQERAQELVMSKIPPASMAALVRAIELAGRHLLSQGVTSVMDAAVGGVQGFDDYLAYREAREEGRLPVRTYLALCGGPAGIMEACRERGLLTGHGDEWLKVGPIKIFTDGSAGGRTAAMSEPYLGYRGDRGIFLYSDAELRDLVEHYHRSGYQVAIHAIGDAAIEQTIDAYERALQGGGANDRRHRIEHCGYVSPAQIQRMRRWGIQPAPQPVFVRDFGDLYVELLGLPRAAASYPMRTWMRCGLAPAASSDAPVCDPNVMANLHAMLTRETANGLVLGADERLTMPEALHACSHNGAFASFSEREKGRLEPGQVADLAIADRNLLDAPPDALLETEIDLTVLDGRIVYDRLGEHT